MNLSADLSPLEVVCRTVAPNEAIEWHTHLHPEFCLLLEGSPIVGQGVRKVVAMTDTLFLFKAGETHGIWNSGPANARLWLVEFEVHSAPREQFSDLFDRRAEERLLKLSTGQRHRFNSAVNV